MWGTYSKSGDILKIGLEKEILLDLYKITSKIDFTL